jgi:hypothetical protein
VPYEVVEFSGGLIRPPTLERNYWRGGTWSTDFHVCDERGRTVKRFPIRPGYRLALRRAMAERYCAKLNAQ